MRAIVTVMLKKGIFDPQGRAVHNGLESIGFEGVKQVRVGKQLEIDLNLTDRAEAKKMVDEMCDKMLANPVVESFSYEITEV
ncbi:MAG: phosphoribosylformylglycinamidine synthase subunit PurS [Candidatus Marinimicrobia bacterium]|nr:phosphoribosylformylglycinamidine synthase subunit PurS [Candidatus Neomarinimicrobiota bacterium]MCF7850150.1 phosphoribosylformylglycinamidine synthase subunit PurS [Candidatus Neomarinimicrobiota bacterium]